MDTPMPEQENQDDQIEQHQNYDKEDENQNLDQTEDPPEHRFETEEK
jgi:hypothetical protein